MIFLSISHTFCAGYATIKRDFFMRVKLSVYGAVQKITRYYSIKEPMFNLIPKHDIKLNALALKYRKKQFTTGSKKVSIFEAGRCHYIDIKRKSCDCKIFLKRAICVHTLGFSHSYELDWYSPVYDSRATEFSYKTKKGAPKGCREKKIKKALQRCDE